MIFKYKQFINWHIVTELKLHAVTGQMVESVTKVPFNPIDGYPINPHDPAHWKTYDEAVATGHPVGFALTATDPFFFLDLDKCLQPDNTWTQAAVDICTTFAGAAVEVSQSGKGLHIMGCMSGEGVEVYKNKWDGWCEFYFKERFIALGPTGWNGDFNIDWSLVIETVVPKRDPATLTGVPLVVGPAAEYTGPVDDDELIAKMLASRGSMAAVFGQRASVTDLWTANATVLGVVFPSFKPEDAFDRSAADAALMAHLAFWTGRDFSRMDRLFRMSALIRGKYIKRDKYRNETILKAISRCVQVYDVPASKDEQNATARMELGEYLLISDQKEYFDGCVYVRDLHRVLVSGGDLLEPHVFKSYYGGKEFAMSADGTRPSRNAFEAFTENRAYDFPKAHELCFKPQLSPGKIITDDGKVKVNQYYPPKIEMVQGDVSPFMKIFELMFPVEGDREQLIAYMAAVVQNPGIKFYWAPLIQGVQGNGKGVILKIMRYAVGQRYCHAPAAEDIVNKFNAYLEGKILITVDEIHTEGKRKTLDIMKPLISDDWLEMQPKGVDKRMRECFANWIMCTNYRDAIPIDDNERRYAIYYCAQQSFEDLKRDGMLNPNFFPNLWKWLKADGYAIMAHYLAHYPIPDHLNPAGALHRAPITSSTEAAKRLSLGRIEQEVLHMVDGEEVGFRGGWISSTQLDAMMRDMGLKMSRIKQGDMIKALGYVVVKRINRGIMEEGMKRPMLWRLKEYPKPQDAYTEYCISQGYASVPNVQHHIGLPPLPS